MQDTIFLEIPGIQGPSEVEGYENQIPITSFTLNYNQQASPVKTTAGGLTAGRCFHSDMTLSKHSDTTSNDLKQKSWDAEYLPEVTMTCVLKDSDNLLPFWTVKLSDVVISSYSTNTGGAGGNDKFTLNYTDIQLTYKMQQKEGGKGGQASAKYQGSKESTV